MNSQSIGKDKNDGGNFLANLIIFGHLLRQLDINISSKQLFGLAEGIAYIDITRKDDFYNISRAFLLHDIDRLVSFNLAFDLFWSGYIKEMLTISGFQDMSQQLTKDPIDEVAENNHKLNQRKSTRVLQEVGNQESDDYELDLKPVYSSQEILFHKDFSELDREELRQAKDIIKKMAWKLELRRSRRRVRSIKRFDNLDFRRILRKNVKYEGEIVELVWRRRKLKTRPLVVISDISGSMERYSRIFLYFLYALVQHSQRIETFVFGTRLTRITPALKNSNVEAVLDNLSNNILDWSGGTRIGESLKEFNYLWSRRVTCQGSVLVIISDGWDRGDISLLEKEIGRLRRSVHRLIWLNPLASSPEYQPLVRGMQTVLPYIDDFYPLNNLGNLESLAENLSGFE